jgi:hypothetical protein
MKKVLSHPKVKTTQTSDNGLTVLHFAAVNNHTELVKLVSILQNFFSLTLATRLNKLECFSLETLSSQVLEFEGKARDNPTGVPFRCFFLG